MMKLLENEICTLKKQLEQERRQNSKYLVDKIQKEINEREVQFVGSYDRLRNRHMKDNSIRRRTWCPTSTEPPGEPLASVMEEGDSTSSADQTNRVSFPNLDLHCGPFINFTRYVITL